MAVRSECRKGSEASLSRVPSQWCGSEGALVLIGGEISPASWGLAKRDRTLDACVQLTTMYGAYTWVGQARRHSCISLPMLVGVHGQSSFAGTST